MCSTTCLNRIQSTSFQNNSIRTGRLHRKWLDWQGCIALLTVSMPLNGLSNDRKLWQEGQEGNLIRRPNNCNLYTLLYFYLHDAFAASLHCIIMLTESLAAKWFTRAAQADAASSPVPLYTQFLRSQQFQAFSKSYNAQKTYFKKMKSNEIILC